MDKKQAKILYTINQNSDLTKLDIKNKTGFSMTTVLSCVKKLQDQELITCGVRKVKGGKAPSIINSSPNAYVLGVGYSKGYLRGVRTNLNGDVDKILERRTRETKESIDEAILELTKSYPPSALGVITENLDYIYTENIQSNTSRKSAKLPEGLACFYRFFSIKSNLEIAIIYIDDEVILMRSGDNISYLDISSLFSPILHADKGRLTYDEVLAFSNVKRRLQEKYNADIDDLSSPINSNLLAYRNRISLTLDELINLADKLLMPKIIIVGGYLPETTLCTIKSDLHSKVFYAGDVSVAVAHCAGAMALESLYYYD